MEPQTTEHDAMSRLAYVGSRAFPSLEVETRPTLPTAEAARLLNRKPQTLRGWACYSGTGPIEPIRINGRLAWPVAHLRRLLEVA